MKSPLGIRPPPNDGRSPTAVPVEAIKKRRGLPGLRRGLRMNKNSAAPDAGLIQCTPREVGKISDNHIYIGQRAPLVPCNSLNNGGPCRSRTCDQLVKSGFSRCQILINQCLTAPAIWRSEPQLAGKRVDAISFPDGFRHRIYDRVRRSKYRTDQDKWTDPIRVFYAINTSM